MGFIKATRRKVKLKLAITGPTGSGKTFSALRLAAGLTDRIAVIDTENESASLYANLTAEEQRRHGILKPFEFDVQNIAPPFSNEKFSAAIKEAVASGYEAIIIDSASHFWEGILEYKSKLDARGGNSYTNWNEAGVKFKDIVSAVLQSPVHVICCMRSKMDYVLETNDRGKQTPKKVGLAPIMRDGIEYEFTTVFDVDMAHQAKTSKDRTGLFLDHIFQITEDTGKTLKTWMESGAEALPAVAPPPAPSATNGHSNGTSRPAVETNASAALRISLIERVQAAPDMETLMVVRPDLTSAKANMTDEDISLVATAFSARKTALTVAA